MAQPAHVKNKQEFGCHLFDWDKFRARKGGSVFIGVSSENPSTHPEFLVILQVFGMFGEMQVICGGILHLLKVKHILFIPK